MLPELNEVETLLCRLLEAEEDGWPRLLDQLCTANPEHAAELRRRYEILRMTGLDREAGRDDLPAALDAPERLGDFHLVRRLGGGGMGVVYLAEQQSLQRTVALKVLRPELLYFPQSRERFRREIDAVAQLSHPGIVAIHVVGEEQGVPYFAMEHIAGKSLDQALTDLAGRAPERLTGADLARVVGAQGVELYDGSWPDVCARIARRLAEALAHAHARGVIHRDVKPSNVMLTSQGRVVLLDFGVAAVPGNDRVTRTGALLGSLPYMAPEQVRADHDRVDARSDVYALGVTLYEMLTLRSPFTATSTETTRHNILLGTPTSPRVLNRQVSADAAVVCGTAMEPDPRRRYQTVADLARDLDNVLAGRDIEARPPGVGRRMLRRMQRHPAATVGIVAALLLVVGTPTAISFAIAGQRDRARVAETEAGHRAYEANIAAASTALQAGDGAEVRRRLDACPPALRGFEWRHLDLALDGCLRRFAGHADTVTAVAITDDGECMASGDKSGNLLLWEPLRGTSSRRVALAGTAGITRLGFTPDGHRLVVVQRRGDEATLLAGQGGPESARVVDTATAMVVAERAETAPGERLCLVADGSTLLVVRCDFTVEELDAPALVHRRTVQLEPAGVAPQGLLASDGTWLSTVWRRDVHAWRLADGRADVVHDALPADVDMRAMDAGVAAIRTRDGRLFAARAGPLRVHALDRAGGRLDGLALDRTGTWLVGVADSAVRTWDARNGRLLAVAHGSPGAARVVAIASRRLLAVVGGDAGRLEVYGLFGGRDRQALMGPSGIVAALATTPGGLLVSGSHEPAVRTWRPETGQPERASSATEHWVNAMVVGADGQDAFVTFRHAIRRLRLPDLEVRDTQATGAGWIHALLGLPDGRLLALTQERGLLLVDPRLADAGHWKAVSAPRTSGPAARVAALAPDGRHAFTGGEGTIERWALGAGIEPAGSMPTVGPVSAVACGKDGTTLFSGEGPLLRARAVASGSVTWERRCPRRATTLWLMADGARLVSGHDDGTVNLWDPADGRLTMTLQAGTGPISAIVGDPEGRWVAAGENARITVLRTASESDGFAQRLAQADTAAATHLDEALRRELRLRADVLAMIERRTDLDAGLRAIMTQVERMRPACTWEDLASLFELSIGSGKPAGEYERALRVAEGVLAEGSGPPIAIGVAALSSLRLGRPGDALRHADAALASREGEAVSMSRTMRAVRAMALAGLHRIDEARADLLALQQTLAGQANPDVDELRLMHEAERAVAK